MREPWVFTNPIASSHSREEDGPSYVIRHERVVLGSVYAALWSRGRKRKREARGGEDRCISHLLYFYLHASIWQVNFCYYIATKNFYLFVLSWWIENTLNNCPLCSEEKTTCSGSFLLQILLSGYWLQLYYYYYVIKEKKKTHDTLWRIAHYFVGQLSSGVCYFSWSLAVTADCRF